MSEHIYYTILIALLMTALGFEIAIYLQQLGVIPYSSSQGGRRNLLPFFLCPLQHSKKNKSLTLTLTYCILVGAGAPNPNPNPNPERIPLFYGLSCGSLTLTPTLNSFSSSSNLNQNPNPNGRAGAREPGQYTNPNAKKFQFTNLNPNHEPKNPNPVYMGTAGGLARLQFINKKTRVLII